MPGLLVSVRDAAEAELALAAGVDLIDVKEPLAGPLGAADPATIGRVATAIARAPASRRVPLSVALGELTEQATAPARQWPARIDFAKLGLAGCAALPDWRGRWASELESWPARMGRVAVVYADWRVAVAPPPADVLDLARELGCTAALVDTFDKSAGSLVEHWTPAEIREFIGAARQRGMLAVVGGGLARRNLGQIVRLEPDFIAVRGAACRGGRSGPLCRARLRRLVQLLRPRRGNRDRAERAGANRFDSHST